MQPPLYQAHAAQAVRDRLSWALQNHPQWRDARVELFGSAAGGLATATSDVDLSLVLPASQEWLQQVEQKVTEAEAAQRWEVYGCSSAQ